MRYVISLSDLSPLKLFMCGVFAKPVYALGFVSMGRWSFLPTAVEVVLVVVGVALSFFFLSLSVKRADEAEYPSA